MTVYILAVVNATILLDNRLHILNAFFRGYTIVILLG